MSNSWYYNTQIDGDSTSTKTVCTSNCDIFNSISGKDFRLKTSVGGGMALSAPFNVDMNGVTRGSTGSWDRGTYQYAPATALAAPTNLTVK